MSVLISSASLGQTHIERFDEPTPPFPTTLGAGLVQDHYGYLWLLEFSSLLRYDGLTYTRASSDRNGNLASGPWTLKGISGGKHDLLCLYTQWNEIIFYDLKTNTRHIVSIKEAGSGKGRQPTCAIEDSSGNFWIGCSNGEILRIAPPELSVLTLPGVPGNIPGENGPAIRALAEDGAGTIWAGTDGGLLHITNAAGFPRTGSITIDTTRGLPSQRVAGLLCGMGGRLWICLQDRTMGWLDYESRTFHAILPLPEAQRVLELSSLVQDRNGDLWVGLHRDGLYRWASDLGIWESHLLYPDRAGKIYPESVISVIVDKTGILWVLTRSRGLLRYYPLPRMFHSFTAGHPGTGSLSGSDVTSACVDHQGTLWIGRPSGGLDYLKSGSHSFSRMIHDPANPGSLSTNFVSSLCERRNGDLWVGCAPGGINILDPSRRKLSHLMHSEKNPLSLGSDTVTVLFEDRMRRMWVGHYRGIDRFDADQRKFFPVLRWPIESLGLVGSAACILEDHNGDMWFGTAHRGLLRMNPLSGDTTWYRHDPKDSASLPHDYVPSLFEDRQGRLWVGTAAGLALLDRETGKFRNYSIELPTSIRLLASGRLNPRDLIGVHGIVQDKRGNLWVSLRRGGIARFDTERKQFRRHGPNDGIVVRSGRRGSMFMTREGIVYCGGTGGVTWFDPEEVKDEESEPFAAITQVQVLQESRFVPPAEHTTLSLDHSENTFSIGFSLLDFRDQEESQIEYRLDDADHDWFVADRERRVTYANLHPGTYTFRVRGRAGGTGWSTRETLMTIRISPPWWNTPWAYAAYLVGVLGVFLLLRRYEKSRERLKQQAAIEHLQAERLREMDRLKSRLFADISHEFRTPLTLILGPLLTWRERAHEEKEGKDLEIALRNTRRLIRLVNQLLDLSKIEAGQMKVRATRQNIGAFVKGVARSFESSSGLRQVRLNLRADEEPIEVYFDRDKMEKILTNLLSNAFKFTPDGGTVSCTVCRGTMTTETGDCDAAIISVSDTGAGIPAEELSRVFDRFYQSERPQARMNTGTGIGLALTRELVQLHHGAIRVESTIGRGATFTVEIPLGRSHLKDEECIDVATVDEDADGQAPIRGGPPVSGRLEEGTGSPEEEKERPVILVVEDNADVRAYIRDNLNTFCAVKEAQEGEEGLRVALETIPDLIVSDVIMPKMDGLELCRKIKTNEVTSHIPVILLTARAAIESRYEGLETGADDYLVKPFEGKELQIRAKNLIEQRNRLRERYRREGMFRVKDHALASSHDRFLSRAVNVIEARLSDSSFTVEIFAAEMYMSRMQLHRKIKALTGHSPWEVVRIVRMDRAGQLLRQHAGTIAEIAMQVGYEEPTHFTVSFRRHFGVTPSEYVRRNSGEGG